MTQSQNYPYPDCRRAMRMWLDTAQMKAIAAELGITSRHQIYNVISGKCKNFELLERLIQKAESNKALYLRARELEQM